MSAVGESRQDLYAGRLLTRAGRPISALTGGFLFGFMRFAPVFSRLLRIARLFPSHVARVEMVLAVRILARLLLVGVLVVVVVVGHMARSFARENNT
jgi:hypothetical protein